MRIIRILLILFGLALIGWYFYVELMWLVPSSFHFFYFNNLIESSISTVRDEYLPVESGITGLIMILIGSGRIGVFMKNRVNTKEDNETSIEENLTTPILLEENLSTPKLLADKLLKTNLSEANLSEANLSDTNFTGANLSKVNLSGANLSGTNLTKADLTGITLRNSSLEDNFKI